MANIANVSIEEMLQGSKEEIARWLVSIQETQREAQRVVFERVEFDDDINDRLGLRRERNDRDCLEYEFLRGLRKVPQPLLHYLNRDGNSRRCLLEAVNFLYGKAEEIAKEILESRGPFPARETDRKMDSITGEHSVVHLGAYHGHYGGTPDDCRLEDIKKQLLEDTTQSLRDYAESIRNIR